MVNLVASVARWQRLFPVGGTYWHTSTMADMVAPTGYFTDLYPMTPHMVIDRFLNALENPLMAIAAKQEILLALANQSQGLYNWAARMDNWEAEDQGELYERCDEISRTINPPETAEYVRSDTLSIYGIAILLATGEELPTLWAGEQELLEAADGQLDELMLACARFVEVAEAAV